MAAAAGVPVWFEPVSVPKAARAAGTLHLLEYISPNAAELIAISEALAPGGSSLPQHGSEHASAGLGSETASSRRLMDLRHHIKRVLDAGAKKIVLTLGAHGAALCTLRYMFSLAPCACYSQRLWLSIWHAELATVRFLTTMLMLQFTWRQH